MSISEALLAARRRVVVTGVGLVSPVATGTQATWEGILAGKSGIGSLTRIDPSPYTSKVAGELSDFDAADFMDRKEVRRSGEFIHYALAAASLALEDSGFVIDPDVAERVAVSVGCGIGGLPLIERMKEVLIEHGTRRISPFFIPGLAANMAAGQVSIALGAKGPNICHSTACTSGSHAIGGALRLIQHGYADAAIAGGTEGVITPLAFAGFCAMRALSIRKNDAPEQASRPWDKDRDGFVIGEGAGIVFLEEMESAKDRGAHMYAEIVGYGQSGDAHHISAPHPEGEGAVRVMRAALEDCGLEPSCIDYINAHGTSTPLGDLSEVRAIKSVFGDHAYKLAVSSTKSATGHLLGAAGGLETGLLALAIDQQILPPTLNLDVPGDECDLDFVPNVARPAKIEYGLTNSFGFGGTNGSLILKRAS